MWCEKEDIDSCEGSSHGSLSQHMTNIGLISAFGFMIYQVIIGKSSHALVRLSIADFNIGDNLAGLEEGRPIIDTQPRASLKSSPSCKHPVDDQVKQKKKKKKKQKQKQKQKEVAGLSQESYSDSAVTPESLTRLYDFNIRFPSQLLRKEINVNYDEEPLGLPLEEWGPTPKVYSP